MASASNKSIEGYMTSLGSATRPKGYLASASDLTEGHVASPSNKSIKWPHASCSISDTRSLREVLAKLQLTHCEPMFYNEAVDLHALTLLGPGDLRATFGMPLGLAAKLIELAQIAYSKSDALHQDLGVSATTVQKTYSASQADVEPMLVAERSRTSQADEASMLLGSRDAAVPPAVSSRFGTRDAVAPPSVLSRFCRSWWEAWRSSTTVWSYVKKVGYPVDHRICFVRQCIVAKSNHELKEYLAHVADGWILIFSLLLGSAFTLWSMRRHEAPPGPKLVFDGIMSIVTMLMFITAVIWMVFSVSVQSVSLTNIKAFAITALGLYGILQACLVACIVFLIIGIGFYTYLVMSVLTIDVKLAEAWWPKMFESVVFTAEFLIILFAFKIAMILGSLVHNGCLIGSTGIASVDPDNVCSPVFPSSSEMEARVSHDVWEQVRKLPDDDLPVEYLYQCGAKGDVSRKSWAL